MGEKKQAEKFKKNAYKVLAVIAGVLFVVLMVVSSMGSSWISGLATVKPGDVVVLDYTLRDAQGNPLLTSNKQLYTQSVTAGNWLLGSQQLTITANQSIPRPLYAVQVVTPDRLGTGQYAILASEYATISSATIGMKKDEHKKITLGAGSPMIEYLTNDQMEKMKINLSAVSVGQTVVFPITENPNGEIPNSSAMEYLRLMQITDKTSEGVTLNYNIPDLEISVVAINPRTSNG
jgi:hypothetical protein